MQDDTVYAITDINGYVSQMREAAAKSISEHSHQDNLDDYISIGQMIGLVESYCLGFDANNRPLLNEKQNEIIFHETATMIHNTGLAKLAARDIVECAWDDELNEMVFWHKETIQNDQPKPKRKRKRKNS
jgi:hypothetical protein